MRKKIIALVVGGLLVTGSTGGWAQVKKDATESVPQITRDLVKEVETVGTFHWLVLKDGKQYLISSDGRFVIENPKIYDQQTKRILISIREFKEARKPRVEDYAFFYLSKQGKPAALIVVDQYCGYCERLVKDLLILLKSGRTPKYDIAITFYPIFRKSVDGPCKLASVSPEKAREIYMKWVRTKDPAVWEKLPCDPKKKQDFLMKAAKLKFVSGINSTPVVILPDGTKIVGYRNPEEFLFEPSGSAESQKEGRR